MCTSSCHDGVHNGTTASVSLPSRAACAYASEFNMCAHVRRHNITCPIYNITGQHMFYYTDGCARTSARTRFYIILFDLIRRELIDDGDAHSNGQTKLLSPVVTATAFARSLAIAKYRCVIYFSITNDTHRAIVPLLCFASRFYIVLCLYVSS